MSGPVAVLQFCRLRFWLQGQHNGLGPAIVTELGKFSLLVEEKVKAKHWLKCCIFNTFKSAKKPLRNFSWFIKKVFAYLISSTCSGRQEGPHRGHKDPHKGLMGHTGPGAYHL